MLEMIFAFEGHSQIRRNRRLDVCEPSDGDGFMLQPLFTAVRVQDVPAPRRRRDACLVELDPGLLPDLATRSCAERLAGFHSAAGQFPGISKVADAEIASVEQQNAPVCVNQDEANCVAFD